MAIAEVRMRPRRKLEDTCGEEEAAFPMDRPPGGWQDLVTVPVMNARFDALEYRFDAIDQRFEAMNQRFEAMEHRFDGIDHRFDGMDAKMSSLKLEILGDIDERFRDQTWAIVTALFAMFAVLITAMRVVLAIAT